jgi:hypothetical protein
MSTVSGVRSFDQFQKDVKMKVYIVEGMRQYGDSWIELIFDTNEKAVAYIDKRYAEADPAEDDDLILFVTVKEVL